MFKIFVNGHEIQLEHSTISRDLYVNDDLSIVIPQRFLGHHFDHLAGVLGFD